MSPVLYTIAKISGHRQERSHADYSSPSFSGQLVSSQPENVQLPVTASKIKPSIGHYKNVRVLLCFDNIFSVFSCGGF